jgi:hypothetical protein
MRTRLPSRTVVVCIAASTLLAATVSCAHPIGGTAVYARGDAYADASPVRSSDVGSLVLHAADLQALLGVADLADLAGPPVRPLPDGVLSDPSCGSAMVAGWAPSYRLSGLIGAGGDGVQNSHEQQITETVAAFRNATAARAFVAGIVAQWKRCIQRNVTETFGGSTANFMPFGPSRAYGWNVILVRREGGRGYACSHAIGSGANVTADVVVCGPDETVVNDESAKVVSAVLAHIHH